MDAARVGLNEHPGELSGYGPITAAHARELARHATWRRVLTQGNGKIILGDGLLR
jgi:hypothetical protein